MSNTNLKLRPHQVNALNQLRMDWKQYDTHLMQAPTGAGKTAIAAEIIEGLRSRGLKTLFVAPYTMLINQTVSAFMDYGIPEPGVIWRDVPPDPNNLVQIASADTLIRRDFPECDLVIVDECHIRRKKLLEIMAERNQKWVGLTATPFANWLGSHYDNFIKVTTIRELIDNGYLSDYEIYAPNKPNLKGVKTSNLAAFGKDYVESQLEEIMGDAVIVGDITKTWLEKGEDEPTIAFCVNVAHANHLTNAFNRLGVECEVMTAETPKFEREQIIKRFERGITKIICNVGVLVAGFDSDVRCIIYARPTKSEARWLQCLGRGLRTAKGKERCLIFDHSGTVFRLGLPCSIEYDGLPSDSDGMEEKSQYKNEKEKPESKPKECTNCHYMKPPGQYQCKKCGHKPLFGEDVETDESRDLTKLKGEKLPTKEDKQKFYSELIGFAQEAKLQKGKEYSKGWISNNYKQKFGVWPKSLNWIARTPSKETRNYIKSRQIAWAKSKQNAESKPYIQQQKDLVE